MRLFSKLFQTSIVTVLLATAGMAHAGTLENLERERAFIIKVFLDPGLGTAERMWKIENGKPRLVDLERMVLRDDKLTGRNTPVVRQAFANYDLTFLVHAGAEKNRALLDIWLEQVGVTTNAVMVATKVPPVGS